MFPYRHFTPFLCLCFLAAATAQADRAAAATSPTTAAAPRIAAVGASVTAGFRLADHIGGRSANPRAQAEKLLGRELTEDEYRLGVDSTKPGDVLGATYGTEVQTFADKYLFLNPNGGARKVLAAAFADELDLVIGLDLLFWFGYGTPRGAEPGTQEARQWRVARQEEGLGLLAEFCAAHPETTFVVGDYPDMTGAVPLMIQSSMIPTAEERAELNRRLGEWAKARANVRVFELSKALERLRSGAVRITVGDGERVVGADAAFQLARVHPNRLGVALLVRDLVAFLGERVDAKLRPARTEESVIVAAAGVQ